MLFMLQICIVSVLACCYAQCAVHQHSAAVDMRKSVTDWSLYRSIPLVDNSITFVCAGTLCSEYSTDGMFTLPVCTYAAIAVHYMLLLLKLLIYSL
jgi:hypothetical protein